MTKANIGMRTHTKIRGAIIKMSYTKNEVALETLISNINNQFYYIGEEDDQVAPIDVKKFTEYCVAFIDSLEIEN